MLADVSHHVSNRAAHMLVGWSVKDLLALPRGP
jgi:hypothetical protein